MIPIISGILKMVVLIGQIQLTTHPILMQLMEKFL